MAAVLALGVATSACGDQEPGDGAPAGSTAEPTDGSRVTGEDPSADSDTDAGSTEVQSIRMTRTGGVAGLRKTWRVVPGGEHAAPALAAAEQRADLEAEASAGPRGPSCCDFFSYDVVVTYADGGTVHLVVTDPGPDTPVLTRLVTAVIDSEPLQPDQPQR